MRIAVTGASGFIGRHVLNELEKEHVEIIAVTRNPNNLNDIPSMCHVIEKDISKPDLTDFDLFHRPDVLIHLAWNGLPNYYSLHHFEEELINHYRFLKSLIKSGLPTLVVTGTCFEYGMQSGELSEDLPPLPENPYGFAKDALRRQLEFLQGSYPYDLTWARLFYMYGEGQPANSLYSQFQESIKQRDQTFNMSGGEQLRDYLPVEKIARLITLLAMRKTNDGIVNVCSGKPVSVRSLVESWIRVNHLDIKLNFGYYNYPNYEPMAFWGSKKRLDTILKESELI